MNGRNDRLDCNIRDPSKVFIYKSYGTLYQNYGYRELTCAKDFFFKISQKNEFLVQKRTAEAALMGDWSSNSGMLL